MELPKRRPQIKRLMEIPERLRTACLFTVDLNIEMLWFSRFSVEYVEYVFPTDTVLLWVYMTLFFLSPGGSETTA